MLRRLITFAPHADAEAVRQAVFAAGAGHIGKYSECSFNSIGKGTFKAEEGTNPHVGEVGKQHQEEETKIEIVFPAYLELQVVKALVDAHPYEEVAYDIFAMENIHYGMGAGIIGELDVEIEETDFLRTVKAHFKAHGSPYGPAGKSVKKVAVCGGSGAFLIKTGPAAGRRFLYNRRCKVPRVFRCRRRAGAGRCGPLGKRAIHHRTAAGADRQKISYLCRPKNRNGYQPGAVFLKVERH
jgi:hypothetical protein